MTLTEGRVKLDIREEMWGWSGTETDCPEKLGCLIPEVFKVRGSGASQVGPSVQGQGLKQLDLVEGIGMGNLHGRELELDGL